MNRFNPIANLKVAALASRRVAAQPRIIPARGDAERAAHRGDAILGLIALHESEDFFGSASVSRANQAAVHSTDQRNSSFNLAAGV